MKTFIIKPYSWQYQRLKAIEQHNDPNIIATYPEYVELLKIVGNIGYFKKEDEWHCKTLNDFYEIGNIRVEKCTYDPNGNKIKGNGYRKRKRCQEKD